MIPGSKDAAFARAGVSMPLYCPAAPAQGRSLAFPPASILSLSILLIPLLATLPGCGGGGGGGGAISGTSPVLDYSKYRVYADPNDPNDPGSVEPILSETGAAGDFDSDEVDSPAVAVDKSRPNGDFFLLYYEAQDAAGVLSIGLLTSDEEDFQSSVPGGIDRTQVIAPSQDPGLGAFDAAATDPTVVVDKRSTTPASERYKMWFEGRDTGGTSSIIYCTSADGVTWTGFQVCSNLSAGVDVTFGDRIGDPTVILDKGALPSADRFRMWFDAVDEGGDGSTRIGYAESVDGVAWTVRDAGGNSGALAGPVIAPGFGGALTAFTVEQPAVVLLEGGATNLLYHIWYTGGDVPASEGTEDQIFYATSPDGLSWTPEGIPSPYGLPVLQPTSDSIPDEGGGFEWDSGDTRQPAAWIDDAGTPTLYEDDIYHLWYAGDVENGGAGSPNRIGYAKDAPP